jgi:hypothetical protein
MMECETSSDGSAPWDQPLTRAINLTLEKRVHKKPADGRVAGVGINTEWNYYYNDNSEQRKKSRKPTDDISDKDIEKIMDKKVSSIIPVKLRGSWSNRA